MTHNLKDKPILFNFAMVRSILNGKKKQTRRPIKITDKLINTHNTPLKLALSCSAKNPYGNIGDLLWVRETYQIRDVRKPNDISYKATDHKTCCPWKPSIFMPRSASRLTLEIKNIDAKYLHEITTEEILKEGLSCLTKDGGTTYKYGIPDGDNLPGNDDFGWHWHEWEENPIHAFKKLWNSIYSNRLDTHSDTHWDANPIVWVADFQPIHMNIDTYLKMQEAIQ